MPVLITCKFDNDPIKDDLEKLETSFFFFSPLKGRQLQNDWSDTTKIRDFMPVLISRKFDEL